MSALIRPLAMLALFFASGALALTRPMLAVPALTLCGFISGWCWRDQATP